MANSDSCAWKAPISENPIHMSMRWTLQGSGPESLAIETTEERGTWRAELRQEGAMAKSTIFHRWSGDALELDRYFAGLAERWRGWEGKIDWEGERLDLSATHDGLGHVTVTVVLHGEADRDFDRWEFRGYVKVGAGSLEAVAREAAVLDPTPPE